MAIESYKLFRSLEERKERQGRMGVAKFDNRTPPSSAWLTNRDHLAGRTVCGVFYKTDANRRAYKVVNQPLVWDIKAILHALGEKTEPPA